jgi:hypothetical protein
MRSGVGAVENSFGEAESYAAEGAPHWEERLGRRAPKDRVGELE